MTTFFSPLCNGLYDSETSGFAVSPSEFGTYTFSGTNPDNTKNFSSFTIFPSNLPITTPEPSDFTLLLVGLVVLWMACMQLPGVNHLSGLAVSCTSESETGPYLGR